MTPNPSICDGKAKNEGCGLRSKLHQLLGLSKIKRKKGKENIKESNEEDSFENNLTFDAVPERTKQKTDDNITTDDDDIWKSVTHETEEDLSYKYQNEFKPQSEDFKKGQNSSQNKENYEEMPKESSDFFSFGKENMGKSGPSIIKNEITVNGGNGIQIGHIFQQFNTMNGQNVQQPKQTASAEKTPAIKELLKVKEKIQSPHMQYLSQQFGKKWEEIGKTMVAPEDLDNIKKTYSDRVERGYQMLKTWCDGQGGNVTIGNLCKTLWKTNNPAAQEAVKQLSLNLKDFN